MDVSPAFVDTNVLFPPAASRVPSAELAMDDQFCNGAPVCVQNCAVAEVTKRTNLPTASVIEIKIFMEMDVVNVSKLGFSLWFLAHDGHGTYS